MMFAAAVALFATLLSALGGALLAASRAETRRRAELVRRDAEHAEAMSRVAQSADRAHAQTAYLEAALSLDRVGTATAQSLVSEACLASHAEAAALAGTDGLSLAWSGNSLLADELASFAPDILGALQPGDQLVFRGAHGGEIRAICLQFRDAPTVLLTGSSTLAANSAATALLRLRLERLGGETANRLERSRTVSAGAQALRADPALLAIARDLDLEWIAASVADGLRVGGEPETGWLADREALDRIARRAPLDLCRPLHSLHIVRRDRSTARLSLGPLGTVFIGGAIADEASTLPRLSASIARRLKREEARAA